ncbi:MAG: L,D-transpeptidase family protein [Methylovulum miyakonense]|uniref:L,D-transpeptidase family protein n=1 Tax=Methylovulum miyakonense TaxID=645578 RepID=UPI003BB495BE
MSNTQLSLSPSRLLLLAILSSLSLSGCQTLPLLTQPEPVASKVDNGTLPESVETHEFGLADGQTLVGALAAMDIRENDTLPDIARHFGLGYNDITRANPIVAPWTPVPGSRVLLPTSFILPNTPHQGITLNLANMRLFYYPKAEPDKVYTYPIGIGRQGWNTPTGLTQIVTKKANPVWNVPPSIHQEHAQKGDPLPGSIGPGPNNPLGLYAMNLGFERYLIHGTNKPYGIGMQISHGCVQLYPEDIEVLFHKVGVGLPVRIVHQPYLTAWQDGGLYLEANEPLPKWSGDKARLKKQLLKDLRKLSAKQHVTVDWEKVERIVERADGIPTPVLVPSPSETELAASATLLKHPDRLYQQPEPGIITDSDWAALVGRFDNETEAQKLAAMLTHQGPMIPAHKIQKDNGYLVIAGPFKSKKELKSAVKRIRMDFDFDVEPLKPRTITVD